MGSNKLKFLTAALLLACAAALADGNTIDKVYHPYVQPLEKELEYRARTADGVQSHRLGLGRAFSDQWFAELYLIGAKAEGDSLALEAYELELKWQLTEQGEFNNDWGLLFELEKAHQQDSYEASTTLIGLHEWHRWIATGNATLTYEWGKALRDEWETAFAGQLRYRYSAALEPGLELYKSQNSYGFGPVIMGQIPFSGGNKLFWQFGVIVGLDAQTPDTNWKFALEYEFR